jgi:hypothetical protein
MRKRILSVFITIFLITFLITSFTGCRHTFQGIGIIAGEMKVFMGEIRDPKNVHEEIMNLVLREQYTTGQTILITWTEDAYVDFDFGIEFCGVYIPQCNVSINWYDHKEVEELQYYFSYVEAGNRIRVHFIYNRDSKILYGDGELSHLIDNFLIDYFTWCEDSEDYSSKFSLDNLGDFTYKYVNPIYDRESSD